MDNIEYIIEMALSNQHAGRLEEAVNIYNKVLDIDPKQPDAIYLLGMIAFSKGDYTEAARLINEAILLNPTAANYHADLSSIYYTLNQFGLAKSHANVAIKFNPDISGIHYILGCILFSEGKTTQSLASFERSLDLDPNNQNAWSNYLFAFNFFQKASPKDIFKINRKWGELIEKRIKVVPQFKNQKLPNRRLKLAYYIPELERHVTVRYLKPILTAHDKVKFELFGYGNRIDKIPPPPDFINLFDQWTDINGLEAAEIAELMRSEQIDILLHPCTFKSRYRILLAHRAAPIQVACTNLVSTTGLIETDYLITDNFISPASSNDSVYIEKLIRLSSFNIYTQFTELTGVGTLPAKTNGFVTFGSFNNIAKINPEVIRTWATILNKVKYSRLLLKHRAFDDHDRQAYLLTIFSRAGISADRLIFRGFTSNRETYLSAYNEIDIALDPFPFGGGTVSYEAIWMGVPVLTIAGSTFMGRLSGSLMHQLGLGDWVITSKKQYIATAVLMANDLTNLSHLRQDMRIKAQNTIFNTYKHVLELEDALESVWKNYIT